MVAEKIRLMVVDDVEKTRKNLRCLLEMEDDIEVIGEAANGEEAIIRALQLKPDLVLMDISMPVIDGIKATEAITLESPQTAVIMLTCRDEKEDLRQAMAVGAREYLIKPPGREELIQAVHRVYKLEQKRSLSRDIQTELPELKASGKVISLYSSKGGVGKSTIAVNLATVLSGLTKKKTVIIDLNLQFGDLAMLFDLVPYRTILELLEDPDYLNPAIVEEYLLKHSSGVKILPSPGRPEYAERIQAEQIKEVLKVLKNNYDYILIDNDRCLNDITLTALDASDLILMVVALDVLTVKNVKLVLETLYSLNYESSRIKVILNRFLVELGLSPKDLAGNLNYPIAYSIPGDGKVAVGASNRGLPFVINNPKAPISREIVKIARDISKLN